MDTQVATSSQCPTGGYIIKSGLDLNRNAILDSSEAGEGRVVCNGITGLKGADGKDGANGLNTILTSKAADSADCSNGGVIVEAGLDKNSDSALSADEVITEEIICNGVDGKMDLIQSLRLMSQLARNVVQVAIF